jgi:single-strand DNA-binding protein
MALIVIPGNLGKNPETKEFETGKVCNFSVAEKNMKGMTVWWDISAWSKLGEVCQEFLKKGSAVTVYGDAGKRNFTDKNGKEREVVSVYATRVIFHDKAESKEPEQKHEEKQISFADDNIPF